MLSIPLALVRPTMTLAKPLYDPRGNLLLNEGVELKPSIVNHLFTNGFERVWIRDGATDDIEIKDVVSARVHATATSAIASLFDAVDQALGETPRTVEAVSAAIRDRDFRHKAFSSKALQDLHAATEELVEEAIEGDIASGLEALKCHDDYTFGHSVNVAVCSVLTGKALNFTKPNLRILAQGGMVHDLGKVFVGSAVLNKPGSLTDDEFAMIKGHPTFGFEMLRDAPGIELLSKHIALQHHEKQDGTGYPRTMNGTNRILKQSYEKDSTINLLAEVAAVADVYDALTGDRPYRKGLPADEAVSIIAGMAGTHLNREIVRHFLSVLPVYPLGANVVVTDGKYDGFRGVVTEVRTWNLRCPAIRLVSDNHNQRVTPIELDLERTPTPIRCTASVIG